MRPPDFVEPNLEEERKEVTTFVKHVNTRTCNVLATYGYLNVLRDLNSRNMHGCNGTTGFKQVKQMNKGR
ncbi:hypothetical protein K7X08_015955 [Anisodus acutangulus]|uniref:Uncharacterized protein n=1 Tax=Anisodus acutangulus TaxID=402998 RepID=A0A9Q1LE64_9SOLA|nr:hypothetical protein K7X08_015955 [Anisodus acutangulus]